MTSELRELVHRIREFSRIPLNSGAKRKQADEFLLSVVGDLRSQQISNENIAYYEEQLASRTNDSIENKIDWAAQWIEQLLATWSKDKSTRESVVISQSPMLFNNVGGPIFINYSGSQNIDQSKRIHIDSSKHLEMTQNLQILKQDLQKALDDKLIDATDADTIAYLADQLAASLETNNKKVIQINSNGLEEAARTVASVAPFVLNTANLIVDFIRRTLNI